MDVTPSVMALNPIQLQLDDFCEFFTALGPLDGCSIPQVVQQTGSSVRLKAARPAKTSKAHKAHKAHKVHKAKQTRNHGHTARS